MSDIKRTTEKLRVTIDKRIMDKLTDIEIEQGVKTSRVVEYLLINALTNIGKIKENEIIIV